MGFTIEMAVVIVRASERGSQKTDINQNAESTGVAFFKETNTRN